MTRWCVSLFVLLLVGSAVFGPRPFGQPSFAADTQIECPRPVAADLAAVHRAADTYMTSKYPAIYGSAEVRRVQGDWALVVVTPKIAADRAALILQREPTGWRVVAGPGTAFPPQSRPAGMPNELLEPTGPCAS